MSIYNDLKNSGQGFIYVFIAPDANLNKTIMTKRAEQLARLREMYAKDNSYTPDQMIKILRDGIWQKYKRTPEQILSILFYNNGSRVSGVGEIEGSHFDGTNWVDDKSNEILAESESVLATQNASGQVTSTFWTDVASIIEWIVGLLGKLGITTNTGKVSGSMPNSTDWANLNPGGGLSQAGMGDILPYAAGAAIVYYLITQTKEKKSTKAIQS